MNEIVLSAVQTLLAEFCQETQSSQRYYNHTLLEHRLASVTSVHGEAIAQQMGEAMAAIAEGRLTIQLVPVTQIAA